MTELKGNPLPETLTLLGQRARSNAARWVMWGHAGFALLGIVLHVTHRWTNYRPINWFYMILTGAIGVAALLGLQQLSVSLSRGMYIFASLAGMSVGGLLIHELEVGNDHFLLLVMFLVGIFSLGLVLGFKPALRYAAVISLPILGLGISYNIIGDSIVTIALAFALTLPSKVVENLIVDSTQELTRINIQLRREVAERLFAQDALQHHQEHLEELIAERTAKLAEANVHLQDEIEVRRQTEASLLQRTEELEVRNKELDAYAHTVAHDLKNPLTSIVGFSELLASRWHRIAPEMQDEYLWMIAQKGRSMSDIIDELLLLSSVRKEEIESRPLDMVAIVEHAQQRLDTMIAQQQASIDLIMPSDWPTALGHAPWVEEVWANYLSNALKYGGNPPVVKIGACQLDNGMTCFWIRDNGPGLTREEQSRLFEMFSRPEHTRRSGHGLGLSIVRRIVEKLGGEVQMESLVGQGSSFSFTLPAAS